MNFLNNIEDDSLLIIPSGIKDKILKYIDSLDKLINIKILSFNELKKEIFFDIKDEAILFLMKEYGVKKSICEEYLENIYYIEDKDYKNDKLNLLVDIKNKLDKNNMLIKDNLLLNKYSDKKVYVYGYDYIDSFNRRLLSNFKNVQIIEKEKIHSTLPVYEFNNLNDEIYFVLDEITKLIDNNISLDKIIITNINDNYEKELYKLFNMHHISIEITKNSSVISTIMGKDALNELSRSKNMEDTLNYLKNTSYNLNNEKNSIVYSKILSIFNKYNSYDYDFDIKYECIKSDFYNEKIEFIKKSGIRIEKFSNNIFNDDEYVFFVNFNDGEVPIIHKDENYITDNIKELVNLDKTNLLNDYEKESLINNLLSIKNISITYKHFYKDEESFKSNLIDEIVLINSKHDIDKSKLYSSMYARLLLSKQLDELIKYGKHDNYLDELYNSLEIPYRLFDNRYKGINSEELNEYLNNKINISYSTLNTFYNCSFRYYLDNILKINSFEESFDTIIGNIFHNCLSKLYEDNFNLDECFDNTIKDITLSSKEKLYLTKLKEELVIVIDYIKEFNKETGLTNTYTEKKIEIDKSHNLNVIFKGFVDKIMYKEYDGTTLVSIIDYKTGNQDFDLKDTDYGLSLQLPTYLYLIDKSKMFDSYLPVGIYLQKILSKEVDVDKTISYRESKYKNYKLKGYTIMDELAISRFDPTYDNSKYIESMKLTKEGFSRYAKILTEDEMKEIVNLVDNKIDDMVFDIENVKFDINPKMFINDDVIIGCKYCKYKDICFRKNEDIKMISKNDNLSFLSKYKGDL